MHLTQHCSRAITEVSMHVAPLIVVHKNAVEIFLEKRKQNWLHKFVLPLFKRRGKSKSMVSENCYNNKILRNKNTNFGKNISGIFSKSLIEKNKRNPKESQWEARTLNCTPQRF